MSAVAELAGRQTRPTDGETDRCASFVRPSANKDARDNSVPGGRYSLAGQASLVTSR